MIDSFRPNKGTKLATLVARCIENEIFKHLRSENTQKDVSLQNEDEITLIDILASETDDVVKEVDLKIQKNKI
ncbi:RNA polymerase sigma-28 factor precursor [compost metagenome]